MMLSFLQNIFKEVPVSTTPRYFPHKYFKADEYNLQIESKGYAVVNNAASEAVLQKLEEVYLRLKQLPEYKIDEKFLNSGRFRSTEIRAFVMNAIAALSKEVLPEIFDVRQFDENSTGAFQIKPPSTKSALNPHQDSPVIDELETNALFVWIPLTEITAQNGPVSVLPGSHLWGNHQRSLNVPWPFEKNSKMLWDYMQPVYLKRGDVLCWDTALIHASSPNLSAETRVAITSTILPKKFKMVEYFKDDKTGKGKIEKYYVGKSFWESGDIMKRPPVPPNQFSGYEVQAFPEKLSKSQIRSLIEKTKR